MKYIKRFNESKVLDQSVVDECKDILLELEDIGIKTNIHSYFNSGVSAANFFTAASYTRFTVNKDGELKKNWITIFLSRKEEFEYSDIEDVVERLKSFLSKFGLHIKWQNQKERQEKRPSIKVIKFVNPVTFKPEIIMTNCELFFTKDSYESKK